MNEGKQTFRELLIGIGLFGLLFSLVGILWRGPRLYYYLGLVLGLIMTMILINDMYSSLEKGLTMDSEHASSYFRKKVIIRLAMVVVALFATIIIEQIEILSVLFGMLTLKFSAYLQPLTHKLMTRKNKGR